MQLLEIDEERLATLARIDSSTIRNAPGDDQLQGFLRDAVKILAAATSYSGDLTRAINWYRNQPLHVFGHKTPEELISEGMIDEVSRYIGTLEAGSA